MKPPAKTLVVIAIVANLAVVGFIALRHRAQKHSAAESLLKKSAPELHERLTRQVVGLEGESTAVSMTNLADVNLFYWPGPKRGSGRIVAEDLPLGTEVGQFDIDAICSNRRFCKLVEETETFNKAALSKMVGGEIIRCTADYLKLYEAEMQRFAPRFELEKLKDRKSITGPTFVTSNDGEVVIVGVRLKILALVSMCGALGLADCKTNVEHVARIALKQKTDLYAATNLHPFFRSEMLRWASLYNRQIIGSALLEFHNDEAGQAAIVNELGLKWSDRKLPSYKATLTAYDLPVQSGVMQPDYSLGSRTLKFLTPLDDTQFDQLIQKCGVVP